LFLLLVGTLVIAAPAAAQTTPVKFWAGYQFGRMSGQEGADGLNFPVGFDLGVGFPLNVSNLNVIGDINWMRHSESIFGANISNTALGFGGGVQWASTSDPGYTPFANFLVGAQRSSFSTDAFGVNPSISSTNFMFQPGAGVAFPVGGYQAFVNGNYRRVFEDAADANFFTIVAGIQFELMR
jgi:hypothetical protein